MNLTNIKNRIIPFTIAIVVILLLFAFIIFQQITRKPTQQIDTQNLPPPISSQPVVNGHFDSTAQISQRSKAGIDKLKPYLPIRTPLTTSTGSNVTYAVFLIPKVEHTLYVDMIGIDFQSTYNDPNLPKNVQNFRDVANAVLGFIKDHNANPSDIFITWGLSSAFNQQNVEAWLTLSDKFPAVVKKDNKYVFEKQPLK